MSVVGISDTNIYIVFFFRSKDIECFFGILKARFAILRVGMRFRDPTVLDHVFKVF